MYKHYRIVLIVLLVILLFSACQSGPEAPSPTASLVSTPSQTASPSLPAPTSTPTPSFPTATIPPSLTPSPTEPTPTWTRAVTPTAQPSVALGDLQSPSFVAQIPLHDLPAFGHDPVAVTFVNGRLYVVNRGSATLSVIEDAQVVEVVPLGAGPAAMVADRQAGNLYVANQRGNTLSVISGTKVDRSWMIEQGPRALGYVDGQLFVGLADAPRIQALDAHTGDVRHTLKVDGEILALAVDEAAQLLFLNGYEETYVIDYETWEVRYKLLLSNYVTVAASPALGRFYISEYDAAANQQYLVAVRSSDGTLLERVPIGQDPRGAAVDSVRGQVYVANSWSNTVTVIQEEPFQVLETIPVGLRPMDVTVDDETGRVYVANGEGDNIAVIDGEALHLVDTIPLAMQPRAALVHPSEEDVYVVNANTNSVYVIRGTEVVDEIPVGVYPVAAAFDLDGSRLFVANQVDGTMSVIDIETGAVVTTIAVGEQPQAVAVDPENGQIYVGSLVLDGETLEPVGEIVLNPSSLGYPIVPQQIRVDPQGNRLYVVAFNGIPGSNGADMIYVLDRASREPIQTEHRLSQPSVLDLVLDPVAQRLYSVAGRFGRNSVIVEALPQGQDLATLELWKYPRSVGYNPDTEHLFIGLNPGSRPDVDQRPEIRVLRQDLTKVNALPFPGRPGAMAVDTKAGRVYVCDQAGGQVIVIQDMRVE